MHLRPGTRLAPALAALLVIVAATAARANELPVGAAVPAGIAIHDAAETLRDRCATDADGRLWLTLPGGARYELVTSTADPAIANPGDGAFHAFDAAAVRAALAAVTFPLAAIRAEVYLLPYPRRAGLESAAGAGLVLLSPGVRPLSREQQHLEFTHELGHVVQRALLPDADGRWGAWRALRGAADAATYSATAPHVNRPHEIFAEDFRALFGGALANYSGTVENAALAPPAEVAGLRAFVLQLAGAAVAVPPAWPNPSRGAVSLSRAGEAVAPLDVYDAAGRLVVTLAPLPSAGGVRWSWDGRDARGVRAGAGAYWARPRDGGAASRITRLE